VRAFDAPVLRRSLGGPRVRLRALCHPNLKKAASFGYLQPGDVPLTCGICSAFGQKNGQGFCTIQELFVDRQERVCELFDPVPSDDR